MRHNTRKVKVGKIFIGSNSPISIQSMCNTKTSDIKATLNQINELKEAGCEIIRVAVPDKESVEALRTIKENITLPLVADIHFDHNLAIASLKYADKIRINPGNIGSMDKVKEIIEAAKEYQKSIRIGINSGSLEQDLINKYGVNELSMVESCLRYIKFFEANDFYNIILSLKSSDVTTTIKAYQLISEKTDYPLHLGVTEAGTRFSGTIKSSVGIGSLLSQGIGDTIMVSLTDNPVEEVKAGFEILKSLNLRKFGREIISCPTCGRTKVNLIEIAKEIEEKTEHIKKPIKIAVMGCAVNGPGEAREADVGVAMGEKSLIFSKGKIIAKVDNDDIILVLLEEIEKL